FRDWRAVMLPALVVALGIIWTIGLIAEFDHRLNVVTSVLPALFVIIGMATTVHLCTAYYDHFGRLNDRRAALIETFNTVGISTFLACLTTAIGFAVLVLSGSELLSVFGQFSAVGIMLMYGLALSLIPLSYAHLRPPSREVSTLIAHDRVADFFGRLADVTHRHRRAVLISAFILTVVGVVGASRISTDLYVFSDFQKSDPLRRDLAFFEEKFGGVLPLEVVIEADQPGTFRSLANMRRIDRLEKSLDSLEHVSRSLSATDLVKLANQAYFGGNPATYRLPSSYELPFLQTALRSFLNERSGSAAIRNLPLFVDSTFSVTRVFLGVSDVGTTRMNELVDRALAEADSLFATDDFDVYVTGTAVTATRSGETLVQNLIWSLIAALVMIAVLMALLFRSARLTMVSLVPNIIPMVAVAGAMGFWGITLKPSTALIFSLAFGIAVDASIHFLAKYRLLLRKGLAEDQAVRTTMKETGKAILVNSLVLMAGFLVFTLSSFGGTVSMGGLTALTLGVAMCSNLLVLPAMLFRRV
ncbi:MAG TPA: MMPL family transporter, partial [Rhodothermales bacterium]